MGIGAELRRQKILEQLNSTGRVYVRLMAGEMGVTEVTIRRDLASIQRQGLIKKTYGGAVPASPEVTTSVRYRQTRRLEAKRIVGRLAAALVEDGDIIYLEAGSTCYEIIPHLARKKNLTIIVNSLYLMRRLGELVGHKIIIIGGEYRPERMDMVGPAAEAAIAQLSGFKAFTGADDIAIDAGISGADVVTVGFAKLVLKRASEVIFVGDRTKFDNPALYKIADIDRLDYIVTDVKPSKQWHEAAKQKDIRLLYPSLSSKA
jgi:DeoR/GlpR family transcriptional regulator of sugar metabolism